MFARSVARKIAAPRVQARSINSAAHAVYNTSGKSTSKYIGVVLVACVAGEVVYHGVTDYIWESANKGVSHITYLLFPLITFFFNNIFFCIYRNFTIKLIGLSSNLKKKMKMNKHIIFPSLILI